MAQTTPKADGIGAIPGYPEDGDNAWRASNDQAFKNAVDNYNKANNTKDGDVAFWTAKELKAQAMVESGNSKEAFQKDPLQVNNPGDWAPEKTKLGLTKGQAMTAEVSATAALSWLKSKMEIHNAKGEVTGYRTKQETWERYNGNNETDRKGHEYHKGETHKAWYAKEVARLAGDD